MSIYPACCTVKQTFFTFFIFIRAFPYLLIFPDVLLASIIVLIINLL
jgi:hypothetical protein